MSDQSEQLVSVKQLYDDNRKRLQFRLADGGSGIDRLIGEAGVHRPGLALTGFTEHFTPKRVQILGETEISFLNHLSPQDREKSIRGLFQLDIPCVIAIKSIPVPKELKEISSEFGIPLILTSLSTNDLMHLLIDYLDDKFAKSISVHGTLVDVYGTGILFTGRSGIGKSEIALDLVERGHRLVSDDVCILTRKSEGVLIGSSTDMLRHLMEIRGVGIIDIRRMFGIRAVRLQKRVEMEVELVEWDEMENYERLGIDESKKEILGVEIDYIKLPIFPGKNITVIAESLALNLHLKVYGYHPAKAFNARLLRTIKDRRRVAKYLERDIE